MTIRMYEIINFNYFYNEIKTAKLPFKVLFKLSSLAKAIDEKTEFYREKIQEILHEYGEHDEQGNLIPTEDGNGIKLIPGSEAECSAKVNELQMIDVELPNISFTIEEFDGIEMTMEIFNLIRPFVIE